ncbi:MAG: adenylate/guanylate cyclase domain-containing protein [Pseudobdellovibrionaceae bacterium]
MAEIHIRLTKQHFSTRIYQSYFFYLHQNYPEINLDDLCRKAGLPKSYFDNQNSWVSIEFNHNFIRELNSKITDPNFAYKVGQASFNKQILGPIFYLAKNILTLEEIYNNVWRLVKYVNKVISYNKIEKKPGYVKISIQTIEENLSEFEIKLLRNSLNEIVANSIGYYSGLSKTKHLPNTKIETSKISEREYHLEIKYSLERAHIYSTTIFPAFLSLPFIGIHFLWFGNLLHSLISGLIIGSIILINTLRLRQKDLIDSCFQSEETLQKMDSQYQSLIETKILLQNRLVESQAINELTNTLIQAQSTEQLLGFAAEKLTTILSFDRVVILLQDEDRKFLEVKAFSLYDNKFKSKVEKFKLPTEIASNDPNKVSNIMRFGKPVLIADVSSHLKTLGAESQDLLVHSGSKSFIGVPIIASTNCYGVLLADTYHSDRTLNNYDLDVLSLAGRQIAIALEKQIAQTELLEANIAIGLQAKSYSRFVPFEFINILGYKSVMDIELTAGKEIHMAVVFGDIRGFTTMSEVMTPADSVAFLNSYFSSLAPVFKKYNGIIDKFLGDGIMALFLDTNDAFKAALEFQKKLNDYNLSHRSGGQRNIVKTGMGIHFGKVLLGAVGYEDRLSISVVSDAVNLASRLDGLTKKFGVDIVTSEEAFSMAEDKTCFRLIAKLKVDGRSDETSVYEYFGHLEPKQIQLRIQSKPLLHAIVNQIWISDTITKLDALIFANPIDSILLHYQQKKIEYETLGSIQSKLVS